MKKALVILLSLAMIGVVFAEEPKPELKVSEFTGSAAVLFGADLDTGAVAFNNEASASLKVDIVSGGDKATSGSGIWGELKIKTDGDPIRVTATNDTDKPTLSGKVVVDVAKLHFGDVAYLGIKKDGTSIDYAATPATAGRFFKVNDDKYYGIRSGSKLVDDVYGAVGPKAEYGVVFGVSLPKLFNLDVDFRSFENLVTDGSKVAAGYSNNKNAFGVRAKAALTAVDNLTLEGAVNTGFDDNLGFGAKAEYKFALNDTYYLLPNVGFNGESRIAGDEKFGWGAHAGLVFGWGAKSKIDYYFFDDSEYYPGVAAGITIKGDTTWPSTKKSPIGLNVSAMSGSIVPNLNAAVAFEVADLQATNLEMGIAAVAKYDVKMDPMTITPKFGISYYSDASKATDDKAKTDIYVKAGLDIAKIFPNTTLSFEYASNDLNGGVNEGTRTDKTMGLLYTKLKISF